MGARKGNSVCKNQLLTGDDLVITLKPVDRPKRENRANRISDRGYPCDI